MNSKRDCRCGVVFLTVGLALFAFGGCGKGGGAASTPSGSAEVSVMALSTSDVASATVTISATDIANPIVVSLVATGGTWGGTIGQIPAGSNRTFTLSARDSAGVEQYHGTVTGVTITAGQTTTVVITAQQVTPPPPHNNAAPVIDGLAASAVTVAPGSVVSLTVTAHDPNPGDTLTYAWSAAAGTFTSPSAPSTNWTAPSTAGTVHITIDVHDQLNAHATMSLDISVVAGQGQGSATITVSLNTWPVISDVAANPTRVDAGQAVALNVVAADSDGDALSYLWSCDCQGTFSDTTAINPSFTLTAVPTSNACTVTVTVQDGKGGSDTGSIAIAAGPAPAVALPPTILSAYQSASSAAAGQAITMSVQAVDPNGGALSFAWTATQETLGQPSTVGGTSQVVWTAPTPFTTNATVQVTVTDAIGQTTTLALAVQPSVSTCASASQAYTRPTQSAVKVMQAGEARAVAVDCPSGDIYVASQQSTTGVLSKLNSGLADPVWLAQNDGLDFRAIGLVPTSSTVPGKIAVAGIAAPGVCGASDTVGDAEGKSMLALVSMADGGRTFCQSQTVFPYSGYEQNLALGTSATAIYTAGLFETCGWGNYVNVLTEYDLIGSMMGRMTEPGVDFGGYSCIGPSIGYALATGLEGAIFVAGSSSLTGEGVGAGFVSRFDGLNRTWKTRSSSATEFIGAAFDQAVFVVGTCPTGSCIEKYESASGALVWSRTAAAQGNSLKALVAPGNGRLYAVGSTPAPNSDALILEIDAQSGDVVSTQTYATPGEDIARAIATTGRELIVAGDTTGAAQASDGVFIVRFSLLAP
jgi:hypothetical protein